MINPSEIYKNHNRSLSLSANADSSGAMQSQQTKVTTGALTYRINPID